MQTVDEAKIGCPVQLEDAQRLLMFVDQYDGTPFAFRKLAVDALHFAVGVLLQRLVCRQLTARGRGHLQQADSPPVPRILVKQRLERLEAFDDSLGEVPALDAQADDY